MRCSRFPITPRCATPVRRATRKWCRARSPSVVSEATADEELGARQNLRRSLLIQRLEGSRFVRGGRYGISIDFGLEVVEKQSVCGTIFESEFIELTQETQAQECLIVPRDIPFCKTPSLESPMPPASGTR